MGFRRTHLFGEALIACVLALGACASDQPENAPDTNAEVSGSAADGFSVVLGGRA